MFDVCLCSVLFGFLVGWWVTCVCCLVDFGLDGFGMLTGLVW